MFTYVIRKMWNKKWMAISLIIGNVLLIGMVVGNMVYSNAILNRVLVKDLNKYMIDSGNYPLQNKIEIRMDKTRSDASVARKVKQLEQIVAKLPDSMQLDEKHIISSYYIRTNYLFSPEDKEDGSYVLDLAFLSDIEEHSSFMSGSIYSDQLVDGAIEVIVSRSAMIQHDLMIGTELYLADVLNQEGNPYKIRVVGVFQNSSEQDVYWVDAPDTMNRQFYMDENLFKSLFVDYENPQYKWNSKWNVLYNLDNIKAEQVEHILLTLDELEDTINNIDCYYYKEYFGDTLKEFQIKQVKLENILFLLEIPILILLLIFIYMVNNQMMLLERGDIAVLKSRGASNAHIIMIYLIQGLIIAFIGLLLGIPLGILICYAIGNTNAFLEFVSRTALELEFTKGSIYASLLCSIISLVITLVLAFIHTRESIVSYKRKKNQKNQKNIIKSFIIGLIFLGISLYGLYNFRLNSANLMQIAEVDASLDPLLFISSIFFIIGAAFIIQALFRVFINIIYRIGINHWKPSSYAAFQQVIKGSANQGFIIIFLILTVALGIYSAAIARTINENEKNRLVYSISSDLVLKEKWKSNEDDIETYITTMKAMGQNISENNLHVYYIEPDFNKYLELDGVEEVTKVFVNNKIQLSVDKGKVNAALMGINTKEFGKTAHFKTDLLDKHWYHYLNDLAMDENGVIVSSNLRDKYGYKIGDSIFYHDSKGSARSIIRGFVDYWPAYQPVSKEKDADGIIKEKDQFLIVANLSKVQASWGVMPYEVWIKVKDSTSFIYDFAESNNIEYEKFMDLSGKLIEKNNDPFFQGTNGVLTLGFIVILLICAVGFLIFWILSILSRTLQMGVFRAMGMNITEVIGILLHEQLFLSAIPIIAGVIIGNIVSKLYVPLIQIAYTSAEQMIPLEVINESGDRIRILMIVGFMIILCMVIIGKLILDLKITQALKLGED